MWFHGDWRFSFADSKIVSNNAVNQYGQVNPFDKFVRSNTVAILNIFVKFIDFDETLFSTTEKTNLTFANILTDIYMYIYLVGIHGAIKNFFTT